jgi:hypothetical protein
VTVSQAGLQRESDRRTVRRGPDGEALADKRGVGLQNYALGKVRGRLLYCAVKGAYVSVRIPLTGLVQGRVVRRGHATAAPAAGRLAFARRPQSRQSLSALRSPAASLTARALLFSSRAPDGVRPPAHNLSGCRDADSAGLLRTGCRAASATPRPCWPDRPSPG